MKISKETLKDPCSGCYDQNLGKSICCSYVDIHIEEWRDNLPDYDYIYLMLTRKDVVVDVPIDEEGNIEHDLVLWNLYLASPCCFLDPTGKCTNYSNRPIHCSYHSPFPVKGRDQPLFCDRYAEIPPSSYVTISDPTKFYEFIKEKEGIDIIAIREDLKYDMSQLEIED